MSDAPEMLRVEGATKRYGRFTAVDRLSLVVRRGDGPEERIDARPSDAIALALRAGAPISVEEHVIAKARDIDLRGMPDPIDLRAFPPRPSAQGSSGELELSSLPAGAFGKWKM